MKAIIVLSMVTMMSGCAVYPVGTTYDGRYVQPSVVVVPEIVYPQPVIRYQYYDYQYYDNHGYYRGRPYNYYPRYYRRY